MPMNKKRASDSEGDRVAALARAVDGKVIPLAGGMAGAWFSGRLYVNSWRSRLWPTRRLWRPCRELRSAR